MATNPIGKNNAIVQSCVIADDRFALGQIAFQHGTTVSKYVARLIRQEVSRERLCGHLNAAAQVTMQLGCCILFALGCGFTMFAALGGNNEPRGARRPGRRDDVVCMIEEGI